ncbi:ATP-binding cassette domain-containing protein [Marinitenerispora sediminis]|uniref:Multidrug ABC transporter ATP-binding protein n=1 Tax=Marinitenerispora sediminis TaxID=1931232 RepID=A0A368TAC7_9ACTN|nr:ATP-binding cassette domain-containing protein [Marinitenerispora sediminis]RCV53971.1 multidrug ABC transporter ATP-binding protein [Marinitenerispora sediminis]RCV60478.1 multidrug ABC transporter ATP-binding protein [Marinitenerispora sediminis]RCV61841.1 multidrug ABC transporter ATP-binding protein [Marinitenerispora sediminis]
MIEFRRLTKRYGATTSLHNLSLTLRSGQVTGFLGANGAGKSTTMRILLGLDHPTSGRALIGGRPFAALRYPAREIGALLDAGAAHPGRSARAHLRALAHAGGVPARRVDDMLDLVGLGHVADRRAGTFSLGMRQRLGIAAVLLGDPAAVVLDEPVNGLDPDGVRWIRGLIRSLAADGRTVFVSSHLMSEMQETADHLVVLVGGRLVADAPLADFVGASAGVRVRSPQADELARACARAGLASERYGADGLLVAGGTAAAVGDLAHRAGLRLHELAERTAHLEDAYLRVTGEPTGVPGAGTAAVSGERRRGRGGTGRIRGRRG